MTLLLRRISLCDENLNTTLGNNKWLSRHWRNLSGLKRGMQYEPLLCSIKHQLHLILATEAGKVCPILHKNCL